MVTFAGVKTRDDATNKLSSSVEVLNDNCFFISSQSGLIFAVIISPVSVTKFYKRVLVTSVASIQKLFNIT